MINTELLGPEELKFLRKESSSNEALTKRWSDYTLNTSLNTIEHLQQQLAQSEAEVTALIESRQYLREKLEDIKFIAPVEELHILHNSIIDKALEKDQFSDHQATAEAHNAKQQRIGYERGIRDALNLSTSKNSNGDNWTVISDLNHELEALITKEME